MPNKKIVFFVIILIILSVIFVPGYSKIQKLKGVNEDLAEEIKELKIKNIKLKHEVTKLSKDLHYVEKTARDEMGLGKTNEVIYRITEEEINE